MTKPPASSATTETRLFVIDTNVLMHDPTALFRFKEHDLFVPMVVLEELDSAKKGTSEVARNVRQTSRFLDDMVRDLDAEQIRAGLPLEGYGFAGRHGGQATGRLFLQTEALEASLPKSLAGQSADNSILAITIALREAHAGREIVLVSKDINLRIKAAALGIYAEDYFNDKVLDDVNLLYSGYVELPESFWETHGKDIASWQETDGRTFYRITGPEIEGWFPNQCLSIGSSMDAIVREVGEGSAVIERVHDHRNEHHAVWGIRARNVEQNFALNLLLDEEIDFVTLLGMAGTGKTLLALAAGLTMVLDRNRYRDIIMTRVTVPVGEDIGFLPGTEEEKMAPWMGALMDNLEVLTEKTEGGDWGRRATNDLLASRIHIHSVNFMRGRTFLNKYIIIDEAQNLTPKQLKTLITRAGPGSKIVCLGNIAQIDTPYLTETSSGLTYVVDRFKNWEHSGHITLRRGERSRLADYASQVL
ncbi:MAG: PhoH family protein [Chromatiales bacterium]|nr:PhoH family protein [Chromatiales bacterium]